MVRKRLGSQHVIRVNKKKDDTNELEQKYKQASAQTDQPSDSTDQEQEQPENGQENRRFSNKGEQASTAPRKCRL